MNNYCRNCGHKLDNDSKFCTNCGTEVLEKRVDDVKEKNAEYNSYKKLEKKYLIILGILFALPKVLFFANASVLSPLCSIAFYITLIYARIKVKESKIIKVIFIIEMILLALGIIASIAILIFCANTLKDCGPALY